jgi:hypothetical protein
MTAPLLWAWGEAEQLENRNMEQRRLLTSQWPRSSENREWVCWQALPSAFCSSWILSLWDGSFPCIWCSMCQSSLETPAKTPRSVLCWSPRCLPIQSSWQPRLTNTWGYQDCGGSTSYKWSLWSGGWGWSMAGIEKGILLLFFLLLDSFNGYSYSLWTGDLKTVGVCESKK